MAIPHQKFREMVLQLLFATEHNHGEKRDLVALLMEELSATKKNVQQALEVVEDVQSHQAEVDALITKASTAYAFHRIGAVERNILRLGLYELFYGAVPLPPNMAIPEAMRLAKKFSTVESATFINAILDAIVKERQGQQPDLEAVADAIRVMEQGERQDDEQDGRQDDGMK